MGETTTELREFPSEAGERFAQKLPAAPLLLFRQHTPTDARPAAYACPGVDDPSSRG